MAQDDAFSDATTALQRGNLADATRILERALERDADNAAYHDLMAGVFYLGGRHADALPHARRAAELAPEVAKYLRGEGTILIALDRNEEAIAKLENVLALTPRDIDARNDLGVTYMKIGRLQAAEAQFRRAINDEPEAIPPHINLGFLFSTQNRFAEAEELFEALLDRVPGHPDVLFQLGRIRFKLNLCFGAEPLLRQALEHRADFLDALVLLAKIQAQRGFFEESQALMRRARSQDPKNALVFESLGGIYRDCHKLGKAVKAYRAALKIDPVSPDALSGLSRFSPDQWGLDLCQAIDQARETADPHNIDLQIFLDFAKARALDQVNEHERAWQQAVSANRDFCEYTCLEREDSLDFCKDVGPRRDDGQRAGSLPRPAAAGQPPFVIIIGMPRSGKSTTEELVASIGGVKRGYESNIFFETGEELNERLGFTGANRLDNPMASHFSQFQELFYAKLAEHVGDCSAFTVTMQATTVFNNIPNIIKMMPNPYFIFMDRDIWDNTFRIFLSNYLIGINDFAYRLSSIMQQIQSWRSALDGWLKAEPKRCLAVGYEEMVADPSSALARICGFCSLSMPDLPPKRLFSDSGCAAPYRAMMEACVKDEGW
jgi:tetratricopeptide (TPR) repeat protein